MPTPSGSDPNLGSFNELGATAAAGGIIGTNHLQDAINKLVQAVTDFDTTVNRLQGVSNKLSGGAGISGAWNNNGIETFAKQNAARLGGNFNLAGPAVNTSGFAFNVPNMGGTLGGVCTNTGGGAYKGYGQPAGGSGGAGAFPGSQGATAVGGGGGAGYGGSGTGFPGLGPTPGGGSNVWARATNGGGAQISKAATFGALGATVAASAASFAVSAGRAQMGPQLALNSYQMQAQLMSPLGSNYQANQNAYAAATYGTQGRLGGQASYAGWGNSGPDIVGTYGMIQNYTGMSSPMAINNAGQGTVAGQLMQGVGTLNYLNPGMGGMRAAQLQQAMFSPQMSLSMRALGYPTTPLRPGGAGANGTGQVIGGMMARWGWGANNRLTPNQMVQSLTSGRAFYNMEALGYSPQQIQQLTPEFAAYGRLYEGNGRNAPQLTATQADQLLSGLKARSPGIRAQTRQRLQAYGIGQSDINAMQQNAGSQAATMGDQSNQFTRGLKDATDALIQFRKVIGQINNSTGMTGVLGFSKGFGGMMSSGRMTSFGGGLIGGGLTSLLMRGLLSRGGGSVLGKFLGGGGGLNSLWRGGAGAADAAGAGGAGIGLGTLGGALGMGLAGWGAQKSMEHAASNHIHGRGGSILSSLLGLANPFNFGGWHKDISNLWHGIFGGANAPGSSTVAGGGSSNNLMTSGTSSRQAIAATHAAESQIGVPYQWGAEKPGKGFDCGGLTQWAYKQAGIQLPRSVEDQWKFLQSRAVDLKSLQEGDLVFGVSPGQGGTSNTPTHVGIMVHGGKVLEAPYTGGQIGMRPFMRSQWQRAARPSSRMSNTKKNIAGQGTTNRNSPAKAGYVNPFSRVKGLVPQRVDQGVDFDGSGPVLAIGNARIGTTSGSGWPGGPYMSYQLTDGQYKGNWIYVAENIHPSVAAGQTVKQGQQIATMFNGGTGIETGWAAAGGATTESQTAAAGGISGANLPASGATAIGMNFENFLVSLGVPRAPNFGAKTAGKVPGSFGGPVGGGTGNSNTQGPGSPNWGTASQAGMGEATSEGSTTELAAFMGAVGGGISAGSPWKPNAANLSPGGGSPATGPGVPANFKAGSASANGKAIYQYLLSNLFGGSKVAAAGAIASIWGESGWNPDAAGTGGRGLIGWTPPSKLPNSAFTGNATKDLNAQLPLIIKFVNDSGDQGAIAAMKKQTSLLAAANIWGKQVERYGINDVHPAGLAAAAAIAGIPNNARGGPMSAGSYSLVGERGPEVVWTPKAGHVLDASQSRKLMQSAMGPHSAGPTGGYTYSALNKAFQGGGRGAAGSGGVVVNISTLNLGGGGTSAPTPGVTTGQSPSWIPQGILNTQNPARTFAKYIAGLIEQEMMHDQISSGVNS